MSESARTRRRMEMESPERAMERARSRPSMGNVMRRRSTNTRSSSSSSSTDRSTRRGSNNYDDDK